MEKNTYHFVNASTAPVTNRATELAKSEARAHAARVSSGRRQSHYESSPRPSSQSAPEDDKFKKERPPINHHWRVQLIASNGGLGKFKKGRCAKGPTFRVQVPISKADPQSKTAVSTEVHSAITERSHSNKLPDSVQLPKSISRSALDPFFRPALDLSIQDSHLLHYYLKKVPDELFGTTSSPVSTIIQGGTYKGISMDEITLMWCLIAMESHGVSFQPTDTARHLSILARRHRVYSLMKKAISGETTSSLDAFFLSLSAAATVEKRLGNVQHAEYHLQALRRLLDFHGGLKALFDMEYPISVMVFGVLIETGLPGRYTHPELLNKVPQMRHKLRELQMWNYTLRSGGFLRGTHPEGNLPPSINQDSSRKSNMTRRLDAFNIPGLKDYVEIPSGKLTEAHYRFYLAMLFAVNNALWAFRDNEKASDTYLTALANAAETSSSTGFILQCFGPKLPSLVMLLMIAHYAADSGGRDTTTNAVFADDELFEFVDLMMLASPESRDDVVKALWSWLNGSTVTNLGRLSHAKLDIVQQEIEDAWLEKQSG